MNHSIKKIFSNLYLSLFLTVSMFLIFTLLIVEQKNSFAKIDILQNQKKIINTLYTINNIDMELALIQLNGKSEQLNYGIEKLEKLEKYNFVGKYFSGNSNEYLQNLNILSKLTIDFNKSAQDYYTQNSLDELQKTEKLKSIFDSINIFLDSMTIKNIAYTENKHIIIEKIAFISLALLIFLSLWYCRRLNSIYRDILYLHAIDKQHDEYKFFSKEADAIQLRMNRKAVVTDNSTLIDPLTEVNNYKGMVSAYVKNKSMKNNNFTSVTIFEIDNFSKNKRTFTQSFTQTILKKVAYSISLYEQATDVIARTEYNQFTVILSRSSREDSFKDIDIIRQSISELKFKEPSGEPLIITISGGFTIKPTGQSLEDAIKQAQTLLAHAQTKKNIVSQIKDLAELEI